MNKSNLLAETIKDAFGKYPEDVLTPISSASDVFYWLEAIVGAIRTEAKLQNPNSITIGHLADAAHYLASDFANLYACQHEEMFNNLKQAGLIAAGVDRHG